ncbi:MAG: AEC family transporter [Cyanobacteria bacterium P01_G01_bin.19]
MSIVIQSILWAVFGTILYKEKIVSENLPRLLGRTLYWVGVPLQIFFLARKSDFDRVVWLPPVATIAAIIMGIFIALITLEVLQQLILAIATKMLPQNKLEHLFSSVGLSIAPSTQQFGDHITPVNRIGTGSFVLASILGNTGFIGLALVPSFIDRSYWSWIVLYGLTHNVLGSYGIGVLVADHFSHSENKSGWRDRLHNLLFLPSLWAFAYGYLGRNIPLPSIIETIMTRGVLFVVPGAFILIGMQLSSLRRWQSLSSGIMPAILKSFIVPGLLGVVLTLFGIGGEARLVLVLMSSMPTAFASIILAEEYNLNRQIPASSVLLSTLALPGVLFTWLAVF